LAFILAFAQPAPDIKKLIKMTPENPLRILLLKTSLRMLIWQFWNYGKEKLIFEYTTVCHPGGSYQSA